MSFTSATASVSVDLQKPNICETVYAKQHDRLTRKVAISVYNGGAAYTIPTTSVKYIVRIRKPDGTVCIYEKDENNTTAVTVSGNVATVTLAQQALACPGIAKAELCISNTTGTEYVTVFAFVLRIEESAIDGPASTNYVNPIIPTRYIQDASVDVTGTELTLRAADGSEIVFQPPGGGGGGTSNIAWLPTVDSSGNISWMRSTTTTAPTTRNIKGPQGSTGTNGVSPGVTITTITGGHRVTITDASHPSGQSFDVMDGGGGGGGGVEEAPNDGKSYLRKDKAWTNSMFVFSVTKDSDGNVYLPSGGTVASVYNVFAAGQSLVCRLNDTYYALSSVYIGSGNHRSLTFSHIKGTKGSDVGYTEYIVLDSAASIGNGFTTSMYFGLSSVRKFNVTVDNNENVTLSDGVTVNDVFNAYNNGRVVSLHYMESDFNLVGAFVNSADDILMTFSCTILYNRSYTPTISYITLDSGATVGDGFFSFRYGVDSINYKPVSKTSAMTKTVGVDNNGYLWTTP